ncbi:MAG TPA: EamA family transporter [Chloroflexota bacterium]
MKGLLLVALAALSWGTTGTVLKLVGAEGASAALLVGAIRMAIAGPLLLALAAARGVPRKLPLPPIALAGACMAGYQLCYFSAVPRAGVAITALLAICSAPILVAGLAFALLGERLSWPRAAALAIGVAGAGLLLAGGGAQVGPRFGLGAALALAAGLSYSLYAVITKRALGEGDPLALSALTFGMAAVGLAPVLAFRWPEAVALLSRGAPLLVYLGAVATAGAYWLYSLGLRSVPVSAAVIAGLLEPLVATVLGVALFHEQLGASGFAGAALLVGAVALLGLFSGKVLRPMASG